MTDDLLVVDRIGDAFRAEQQHGRARREADRVTLGAGGGREGTRQRGGAGLARFDAFGASRRMASLRVSGIAVSQSRPIEITGRDRCTLPQLRPTMIDRWGPGTYVRSPATQDASTPASAGSTHTSVGGSGASGRR